MKTQYRIAKITDKETNGFLTTVDGPTMDPVSEPVTTASVALHQVLTNENLAAWGLKNCLALQVQRVEFFEDPKSLIRVPFPKVFETFRFRKNDKGAFLYDGEVTVTKSQS
jgi:hypothetical protein